MLLLSEKKYFLCTANKDRYVIGIKRPLAEQAVCQIRICGISNTRWLRKFSVYICTELLRSGYGADTKQTWSGYRANQYPICLNHKSGRKPATPTDNENIYRIMGNTVDIIKADTIEQYNRYFGFETPHPLVGIVHSDGSVPQLTHRMTLGFYALFIKKTAGCIINYGKTIYDFDDETVVSFAPGQTEDEAIFVFLLRFQ